MQRAMQRIPTVLLKQLKMNVSDQVCSVHWLAMGCWGQFRLQALWALFFLNSTHGISFSRAGHQRDAAYLRYVTVCTVNLVAAYL